MKKLFAILIIVGLLAGCAENSFLCKNGQTIRAGLQLVISQANDVIASIQASYPGLVPPVAQAVLDKAQSVVDSATTALSKACPTTVDLTENQAQMAQTMTLQKVAIRSQGMRLGR